MIHSEGERKAAKALTEAALLLEQNSACLPLRYLQVGTGLLLKDSQQAFFNLDVAVGSISISNATFLSSNNHVQMFGRFLPFHNRFKIVKLVEWLRYVKGLLIL